MSYVNSIEDIKNDIYNKYNHKNFVDVCKKFKFIRKLDTIAFNRKVNNLKIVHLFNNNDMGKVIRDDINSAIKKGTNFVLGIVGTTGSGKSEAAMKIALMAKKNTIKYKNITPEIYICFTMSELRKALKRLKPHDILIKDESPRSSGKGSLTETHSVQNILHSIRFFQNIIIFIDPVDIRIKLCDTYIESAGMNFKTRTNRFLVLNANRDYFGTIQITLHNDEEFRDIYEAVKVNYIQDLLNTGGMVKVKKFNPLEEKEKKPINVQLIYLRKNYNPEEDKEFDLHIFELKETNSFKEICEKIGVNKKNKITQPTVERHYYKVIKELKKK